MMFVRFIIVLFVIFITMSCQKNEAMKSEGFSALWQNYRQWKMASKKPLDYNITVHVKNSIRQIYANAKAYDGKITKSQDGYKRVAYPVGSVVVKEIFKNKNDLKSGKVTALSVMVKQPKHPNAFRGWVYLVKFGNKKAKIMKRKSCFKCHEGANESHPYFDKNKENLFRDFLYVPVYKGAKY